MNARHQSRYLRAIIVPAILMFQRQPVSQLWRDLMGSDAPATRLKPSTIFSFDLPGNGTLAVVG